MSLPYLILQGDAYEQGWTHGQVLAEAVAHNLELYFQRFEREGRLSPREARARGEAYLGALRSYSPTYVQGLEGRRQARSSPSSTSPPSTCATRSSTISLLTRAAPPLPA